jgi:xanthine dehydrogenase/oxidase
MVSSKRFEKLIRNKSKININKIKKKKDCKLIFGNTEIGIETKYNYFGKQNLYKTFVNTEQIKELTTIEEKKNGVSFGSSVSLSRLEEFCKTKIKNLKEDYKKRGFEAILKQLKYFSGTQIRNVSSIGKTLIIKKVI